MELEVPEADDLEVSIFGPGFGECIVIHLGDGRWMVVDSLIGTDNRPIALAYLDQLGVSYDKVVLIIATHWDTDHIMGLADMVRQCGNARVFFSSVLNTNEFAGFADKMAQFGTARIPSRVREIRDAATALVGASAQRKRLADVDTLLISYPSEDTSFDEAVAVTALSPGNADKQAFLNTVATYAFSTDELMVTRAMPFSPNDSSVVTLVSVGDVHVLLGGDLENRRIPDCGWNGVLACQTVKGKKASAYKVSHHGSGTGYDVRVWHNLLNPQANAVIAPWRLAGQVLPQEQDIERLLAHTDNLFVTTQPSGGRPPPRGSIVQNEIRNAGIKITATYTRVGQVRMRRKIRSTADWQIALVESALTGAAYLKQLRAA